VIVTDPDTMRRFAAAIDAAPSVVSRSLGRFGVAAAHLPGERIEGIRRTDDGRWEVHVVMAFDSTVSLVEVDVLGAAQSVGLVAPVDLFVEDVAERTGELPPGVDRLGTLQPGAAP